MILDWIKKFFNLGSLFFFFQAEDGIRDSSVTGVQTCALPIFQRAAQSGRVAPYFFWRWPIFREVIRQTSLHGIDAEGEESIEIGIERSKSEWLKEKVPIECLQMTQIENNTVALGNGTVVEGFGPDNFKQFVTVGACLADSRMEPSKVGLSNGRRVHTNPPGHKL